MDITDNTLTAAADERYMALALQEAERAFEAGEVPIGAVIVSPRGRVVGRGHNLTEALSDVSAHAEMQAITAAASTLGGKYLTGCTLYVTVEPCLMCAGALGWSQISRIVYGASDPKRGYRCFTESRSPFHPRATVTSGVLAAPCAALMQAFFKQKR
ncbi:MAG: nucleoside deaminase [Muribaculaceae bacterium]|nr:nucleoside deaminase [Muribaculaceae bacterium]